MLDIYFAQEGAEVCSYDFRSALGSCPGLAFGGRTVGGGWSECSGLRVEEHHVSLRCLDGRPGRRRSAQPLGRHAAFGTYACEGFLLWGGLQSRRTRDRLDV